VQVRPEPAHIRPQSKKNGLVFVSRVSVLACAGVGTICSTRKLVGESSFTTVNVPSPFELRASIVAGLKIAPSHPADDCHLPAFRDT
jgi:hypothetical protein